MVLHLRQDQFVERVSAKLPPVPGCQAREAEAGARKLQHPVHASLTQRVPVTDVAQSDDLSVGMALAGVGHRGGKLRRSAGSGHEHASTPTWLLTTHRPALCRILRA